LHDPDRRRPVLDDLVGPEAPNELIELDAVDDLPGLGVLVQPVRRRLFPRLRRQAAALPAVAPALASAVQQRKAKEPAAQAPRAVRAAP